MCQGTYRLQREWSNHDAAVHNVLWQCKEVNLKLNKEKCHFRCMSIHSLGGDIERWSSARSTKIKALMDMSAPNSKKELQAFLGNINYFGKFSSGTANVCDPLCKLTSSKVTWTWHVSYQALFNKAKLLIKADMCMKFYDDTKALYLETDVSGIGLGAALLQMCKGTTFHHYCFAREVLITDHKPLVAIFKKDVATLSQCIQCILLKIHQYKIQILYKSGPDIFIADWLLQHNHEEGKDKPIRDMDIRIDTMQSMTDNPECISISQIQHTTAQDEHLQHLKNMIITGWLSTKDKLHSDLRPYWSYRDDLAVIDGVIMKGRQIIIPAELKQQVLNQLHPNHMGIQKTKLPTCKSIYWVNINTDNEKHIKSCNTCLEFQHMQPKEKIIHHDIP